ncbi:MAG: type II toxin-antitoxin system RelE/ParE family toxin [Rhodospirillales bacterium]|nr:type II toxin-antitoxin system RelE/ParE family toxin [Rhodospirillales bacterium]
MPRCRLTAAADRDIEQISDYIALDDPEAARQFVSRLRERCESLAFTPLAGRSYPELGWEVRRVPFEGSYLIFYRPEQSGVTVLNVKHGAMRPETIRKQVRRSRTDHDRKSS